MVSTPPRPGGILSVLVPTAPGGLNPRLATCNATCQLMAAAAYETLLAPGDDGYLLGVLVTNWDVIDPQSLRVRLRPGVRFQNGSTVDSGVVAVNLHSLVDPRTPEPLRATWQRSVTSVETPDPGTVVIRSPRPDAAVLSLLAEPAAAIVTPATLHNPVPIGTGPYLVDLSRPGVAATYVRNRGHWRSPGGYVDSIEVSVAIDAVRTFAFERGAADVVSAIPASGGPPGSRQLAPPQLSVLALALNAVSGPFADPDTRRGVAAAIDRQQVVDTLRLPVEASGAPFGRQQWQFDATTPGQASDPVRVRRLLAASAGTAFDLLSPDNADAVRIADTIAAQLRAAGLRPTVVTQPEPGLQARLQSARYAAALLVDREPHWDGWFSLQPDFGDDGVRAAGTGGGNAALRAALEAALAARIREEQLPHWRHAARILVEEAWHVYLASGSASTWLGVGPRVREITYRGSQLRWERLWLN